MAKTDASTLRAIKAWQKAHPDKVREYSERYERKKYDERRRKARERMRRNGQRKPLAQFWEEMRASGMGRKQWMAHVAQQKAVKGWG